MLVIDIVNCGGTVGFWNARDAREQGGQTRGSITWSMEASNQSPEIPLHQLTNPHVSVLVQKYLYPVTKWSGSNQGDPLGYSRDYIKLDSREDHILALLVSSIFLCVIWAKLKPRSSLAFLDLVQPGFFFLFFFWSTTYYAVCVHSPR